MIDKNTFKLLRHSSGRLDFAVIGGVVLVAVTVDLIAAAGAGIALSILLFIRDQVQGSVILRKNYLDQISSKTLRSDTQKDVLKQHGGLGVICKLQGNLFFGTTDQLFTNLQEDLKSKKYILLDMRRVQSIDYTGVHLLEQMQTQLKERSGELLFSGMPTGLYNNRDFDIYLKNMGLVKGGHGVKVYDTLDSALEFMEEGILRDFCKPEDRMENLLELKDFRLFRDFAPEQINSLQVCVTEKSYATGERVFSHGVRGDEMFLVRRGSVKVLLHLEGGAYHHLATISKGSIFGELAFLDGGIRSAEVEAKEPTDLFIVSRRIFNEQSRQNPELGVQVFARMALAVSERLREADAELRVLEER
jgi:SulP family sulfate permease